MRHVCLLGLLFVVAWRLSPVVAAGETSGSLTVGGDTVTPTSAVAMWNESTAMWNRGAKIRQVYMAPSAISTEGLDQVLDPDESHRYGIEGDYVILTLDSAKELAPQEMAVTGGQLFDGYACLTVSGKDWTGDKVEGKVEMILDGDAWRFAEEDLETV